MNLAPVNSRLVLLGNTSLPKEAKRPLPNVQSNLRAFKSVLDSTEINFPDEYIETICDTADNISLFENIKALSKQTQALFVLYYTGLIVVDQNIYLTSQSSSYENIQINGISLQILTDILAQTPANQILFIFDVEYYYAPHSNSTMLAKELKNIRQKLAQSYFIVSNPESDQRATGIAQVLNQNLHDLENIPKSTISLKDIYHFLGAEHTDGYWFYPFIPDLKIMPNNRYLEAQENLKTAHNLLKKGQWQEAITYYNDSAKFDFGTEISSKIKLIETLQKAELLFEQENYNEAKNIYRAIYKETHLKFIKTYIIACHEKMAEDYLKREALAMANKHYKKILKLDNKNRAIKIKIKDIDRQIHFFNLAQQADQAFYAKNYETALEYYTQIENVDQNPVLKHRKDMAATFLDYKQTIKADLERELIKKIGQDFQKKQATLVEQPLNEKQLWKRVVDYNNPSVYEFFIASFPTSKYTKKAQKRLKDLTVEPIKSQVSVEKELIEAEAKSALKIQAPEKIITAQPEPKIEASEKVIPPPKPEPQAVVEPHTKESSLTPKTEATTLPKVSKDTPILEDDLGLPKPKTETELWNEAQIEDTFKSYLHYINTTQEGTYLTEAYEKVSTLS